MSAFLLAAHASAAVNRWTSQGPNLGETRVIALSASDPSTLYAGSLYAGVFRSDDRGVHWRDTNSPPTYALAVDPTTSATIYLGTRGSGILKSNDEGASWTGVEGLVTPFSRYISAIVVDGTAPDTLYAATLGGVYKSFDRGCTWQAMNTGLPLSEDTLYTETLVIDPSNPAILYLGTFSSGAYRSTDAGSSWSPISVGLAYLTVSSIAIDPSNPERLWAVNDYYFGDPGGGVGAVFETEDSGQSWSPASSGLPAAVMVTILVDPASPSTLWVSIPGSGVFRSDDGAASWTASSSGLSDLTRRRWRSCTDLRRGCSSVPGLPVSLAATTGAPPGSRAAMAWLRLAGSDSPRLPPRRVWSSRRDTVSAAP